MYEIDKQKFGAFVAQLRREKGYTQKQLAQQLYLSDKAVSKWETGVSIPDTAMLIPLSEQLGVTVTELLRCQRLEDTEPMASKEVENVVKTAICYSGSLEQRAWQKKSGWMVAYPLSLLVGGAGLYAAVWLGDSVELLGTMFLLGAIFGAYFCFFVKLQLPAFYDQNNMGWYCDGIFRMNVPGVCFDNKNWPYVVRSCRIWSCAMMSALPLLSLVMGRLAADVWRSAELYVMLALTLGGLFLPIYWTARRHRE